VSEGEREAGAGGDHGWSAGVDGFDDLAGVDALEVDRGHAEVAVAELALDDVERDALAGRSVTLAGLFGRRRSWWAKTFLLASS
jgi:hypothetical protein